MSEDERDVVMECCLFPHGKQACVHACVAMPDHVHLLLTPLESSPGECYSLGRILHGIKSVSAHRIAKSRGKPGPVWQDETFDRIIRHEKEFRETLDYIDSNPAKTGLEQTQRYPWVTFEWEPSWDSNAQAAFADLQARLDCPNRLVCRPWHQRLSQAHRPVAGATELPTVHRPVAGATPTCVFIKHTNACGVGVAQEPIEAYRRAYLGDPNAAMGGILACNFDVNEEFATAVMDTYARWGKEAGAGGFFVEVWLAPSFDGKAVEVIRAKKKWGERVRLLDVSDMKRPPSAEEREYKSIAGGMLVQTKDTVGLNEDQWQIVTEREPTEAEMADLRLAWLICKHTKSNAITVCRDNMLIGNGAGQMSRVMSCRIATWLARENGHEEKLKGSAAASDAFFPFRDGPDILMDAGITAIIQPGGSKRDEDTIAACNERGAAMIFTGTRHFRH